MVGGRAEAVCTICLSELAVDGKRVRMLPACRHSFHGAYVDGTYQEEEAKRKYDEIVRRKRDRNSAVAKTLLVPELGNGTVAVPELGNGTVAVAPEGCLRAPTPPNRGRVLELGNGTELGN
uniref:RING-type domain-containing protein n=1 Tax=Oryza glumipatula TaxID=40148 RepID=A0A0E0AU21_9ORYZ